MKKILLLAVAVVLAATACARSAGKIKGRVVCDGKGVPGVVVSDGHSVTRTNSAGKYSFKSDMPEGYVFISIPTGYEVPVEGLIPQFFSTEKNALFQLKKVCQDQCKLVVFTDLHLTGDKVDDDLRQFRASFLPDFCATAADLKASAPTYTLCLGDMTTDNKWYKNNFAEPEYLEEMKDYPTPIFHVMGNHDNDQVGEGSFEEWNSIAEGRFKKEIGPNYYSMNIAGVHFLMLDDIVTTGPKKEGNPAATYVGKFGFTYKFDDRQMEWIARDLRYVPKGTPIVACFHVPLYKDGKKCVANAEEFLALFEGYSKVDILAGHYHTTRVTEIAPGVTEHMLGSASTVSWKLNDVPGAPLVCDDGTPAGYQIFTLGPEGMAWQFKSVYRSVDESQCSIYDDGDGRVLVNVFNWDPSWEIVASDSKGEVKLENVWADDPTYVWLRKETKMLLKRPGAFLPYSSPHFFRGVVRGSLEDFKVKITDRFGNVYTATGLQKAY